MHVYQSAAVAAIGANHLSLQESARAHPVPVHFLLITVCVIDAEIAFSCPSWGKWTPDYGTAPDDKIACLSTALHRRAKKWLDADKRDADNIDHWFA